MKNDTFKKKCWTHSFVVLLTYLLLFGTISMIVGKEVGNYAEGFKLSFYGFYVFVYMLISLKNGFPIVIKEPTEELFWGYLSSGCLMGCIIIVLSHYFLFAKFANKKNTVTALLLVLNLFLVIGYLIFEYTVVGFATV